MVSPLARRKRLGLAIRELREAAELTGAELADKAGLHRTAVSKVENGERRPLEPTLRLLDVLLVKTDPRYLQLQGVARDGRAKGWWESGDYAGIGDRQAIIADLECGARRIVEYQTAMVPGLLQTENYARHRGRAALDAGAEPFDLDGTVAARLRRQQQISGPTGSEYDVVVEPQALVRPHVPAEIMRDQLLHLLRLSATTANVRVLVLPLDARLGDGYLPRSPFAVYTYPDPEDLMLAAVDTVTEDLLVADAREVRWYAQLADELRDAALSPVDSAAFIQQAADRLAVVS